jgi:beta-lactamase class D
MRAQGKGKLAGFITHTVLGIGLMAAMCAPGAPEALAASRTHVRTHGVIHSAIHSHGILHSTYHSHKMTRTMTHAVTRVSAHAMIRTAAHGRAVTTAASRAHSGRRASDLRYGSHYLNARGRAYGPYHSEFLGSYVDPTAGDQGAFDNPIVRQAAIEALGHTNGSILAVDPRDGRVLTVVNQKMAFSEGFEPCSTIKPVIAVAALQQGLITRDSMLPVARRESMDLTEALAHSNNAFFEQLGERMGFETVHHYASLFGLGERAGYGMLSEDPGTLPEAPPARGGVARMSSFGEGIRMTPLQLVSVMATVADNGTMYYLQYPQSREEIMNFTARIKRQLDIAPLLPDLRDGMLAAVLYGTAKRSYDPEGMQALGKTGTCNDETEGGRLGWFASYADGSPARLALVVLLRGNSRGVNGPEAAEIGGRFYKALREHSFFGPQPPPLDIATGLPPAIQ